MALTGIPFAPQDGTLVISDGAGSPLTFTVPYEDGLFSYSDVSYRQKDLEHFFTRNRYMGSREGRDKLLEFSFDCYAVTLTDGTSANIQDVVRRAGAWATATPTLPTSAGGCGAAAGAVGVWACQVKWTGERSDLGATADSSFTMKYCVLSAGFQEGPGGKFIIKGLSLPYSTDYHTWA